MEVMGILVAIGCMFICRYSESATLEKLGLFNLLCVCFQLPYKEDCNKTICAAQLTLTTEIQ